jgi:hypothetical protein
MLKKAWHFMVCLLPGFILASVLVGPIGVNLGWVKEESVNRIAFLLMPVMAIPIF